jgi:hypothetical protein
MKLQPIETAPKDGTSILCYWEKSKHWEDATLHVDDNGNVYHVCFDGERLNDEPTYWIPRPEDPVERVKIVNKFC